MSGQRAKKRSCRRLKRSEAELLPMDNDLVVEAEYNAREWCLGWLADMRTMHDDTIRWEREWVPKHLWSAATRNGSVDRSQNILDYWEHFQMLPEPHETMRFTNIYDNGVPAFNKRIRCPPRLPELPWEK